MFLFWFILLPIVLFIGSLWLFCWLMKGTACDAIIDDHLSWDIEVGNDLDDWDAESHTT